MSERQRTKQVEHKTTHDFIRWNDAASDVEDMPDPVRPEGRGWNLLNTALGEIYRSKQLIVWTWVRVMAWKPGVLVPPDSAAPPEEHD
jgi:hypothetical protein